MVEIMVIDIVLVCIYPSVLQSIPSNLYFIMIEIAMRLYRFNVFEYQLLSVDIGWYKFFIF